MRSDYVTKCVTERCIKEGECSFQDEVVLKYSISYPDILVNRKSSQQKRINQTYRSCAQRCKSYITNHCLREACLLKWDLEPCDFEPLEIMCEMSVMYENQGFLSVFFDTYQKMGENVLKTTRNSDTWGLLSGKTLPLGCFFKPGYNFSKRIYEEIAVEIESRLENEPFSFFTDWSCVLREKLDYRRFYLADDGIVIYFAQGDISPKNYGLPSFLIPYTAFGSGLKYEL